MPPKNRNFGGAKPQNPFATLKRIFSYMYGFKLHMVIIVIAIISSFIILIIKAITQFLSDDLKTY